VNRTKVSDVIRDLSDDDLEAAFRLDQACFEPEIAYDRSELRWLMDRPGALGLAVEAGGRLAAFAIAERRGRMGHLVTIDIAASARRRGIGRRLFAEISRRLREAGGDEIRLEVDVRNGGAIRFYESLGFETTRTLKSYYGRGLDGFEMVRRI
jgi:[ribosomal protein S18]-alanine N-acetyltransferase